MATNKVYPFNGFMVSVIQDVFAIQRARPLKRVAAIWAATVSFFLLAPGGYGQQRQQVHPEQVKLMRLGPVQYVEPLSGTAPSTSAAALAHSEAGSERSGNTIPAVGLPFGMTQFTAQTNWSENKCIPPYLYKSAVFRGFRASHWLSGSCTQDYGSMAILPVVGAIRDSSDLRLDHGLETATPYEYAISFPGKYRARITASLRSAILEITMLTTDTLQLICKTNSDFNQGHLKVAADKLSVSGFNPVHRIYQGWGQYAGFDGHFYLEFSKAPVSVQAEAEPLQNDDKQKGLVILKYALKKGERLCVKLGTSFTSTQAAEENLKAEIPGWDYSGVRSSAIDCWNQHLSKIQVTGNPADSQANRNLRIFYTSLYHAYQQPRLFNDVSGTYPAFDGNSSAGQPGTPYKNLKSPVRQLKEGNYYDDFSMWDIYRAQLPLMMLLEPQTVKDFVRSILLKSEAGGWTPIFPCWNSYTAAMIGDHSTAFVAAAYQMGIRDFDVKKLYGYLRKNAFDTTDHKAYLEGKGRRALKSYLKYGYIPLEDAVEDAFHKNEQVSRTLEYSYDDYALSTLAKALANKPGDSGTGDGEKFNYAQDYQLLQKRAKNYTHVLDPSVGMVRGRYLDGSWVKEFTPYSRVPYITEGTPAQYSFYVPQDIEGLTRLMGGRRQLENHLDSLFMKGGYWHGNEPGHQIPFMYNFTDAPYKTQLRVRTILAEAYGDGPGGVDGNDDAGQMSAWYVFAAMGFYPVDPVSGRFELTSPLFDRVVMQLKPIENAPTGKKTGRKSVRQLVIQVHRQQPEQTVHNNGANTQQNPKPCIYIKRMTLNGQPFEHLYLDKELFKTGGKLDIWLSDSWKDPK
ncbi:alpha-1,2-mannosidase, putative [Arachidicoccus rhizosphaerae]|uniref:Alpha-1,2-mannosidase, putative n=1 Tax=Arachidicoccus rhizosphaerae TaxID=551991 RepID=A0A1H3Z9H9_9BACT|nr:GH92 family glycosyl hydrolase [Arachidicoccus rhizosphaerae]SEA20188.1 alpha-1,2-mannosidase, putative [Arachidicoccus rhizosphaerae]